MNKESYVKITKAKLKGKAKKIMLNQIDNYYNVKNSGYVSQTKI